MYTIVADGQTIYDQAQDGAVSVMGPKQTDELNQAGELTFVVPAEHPAYNTLTPLASYVAAYEDGNEIFYGRVLTMDPPIFSGQMQVHCEGSLSFLLDGELAPDPKNEKGTGYQHQTQTAQEFFNRCIDRFNAEIKNDPRRKLTVGTVQHSKAGESREYKITSYTKIKDALQSQLIEYYGGYLRIRSDGNGGHLIDWLETIGELNGAPITMGENLISQDNRKSAEDIYTAIRPIGKNGLELTEKTIDLFDQNEMNRYGTIVRTLNFSDAETEESLRTKANEWKQKLVKNVFHSAQIKLIEFHYLDGTTPLISLGNRYNNLTGFEGETLTVSAIERDYESPQNDLLTLKNDKELEQIKSPEGSTAVGGGSTGGRGGGGGLGGTVYKYIHETENRLQLAAAEIEVNAENYRLTANNLETLSRETERTFDLQGRQITEIQGTGVFQNSDHITEIAGKFQTYTDKDGNTNVRLVSGTDLTISDTAGHQVTVGDAIYNERTGIWAKVQMFEGSALWTQKDHITGVTGKYEIRKDESGVERLVIISGGGMNIERNNVEYGLYDNGSLTGGIIVNKINRDTYETKILGDRVVVGDDPLTDESLPEWIRTNDGLVTEKLNALSARIGTLEADSARIDQLMSGQISASKLVAANVVANKFSIATGSGSDYIETSIAKGISDLQLTGPTNNVYKLQYKRFSDSNWQDLGTFSRATTLKGDWAGGRYTVVATPQNEDESTNLVGLEGTGAVSVSGKKVSQKMKVLYEGSSENMLPTGAELTAVIDASQVYSNGRTYGRNEMGVAVNTETGAVDAAVSGTKSLTISCVAPTFAYSTSTHKYTATAKAKAGSTEMHTASAASGTEAYEDGVAAGEANFVHVTIIPQGTAYGSITPIGTTYRYTQASLWTVKDASYYLGNGTSGTLRGDSQTVYVSSTSGEYYLRGTTAKVTPIGTEYKYKYTKLYDSASATAKAVWAYVSDTNGTTKRYAAGAAATYYKGDGTRLTTATRYKGNGGAVTDRGQSTGTIKQGVTNYATALYPNTNGTVYRYDAGTAITNLRNPGTVDTNTYYKKK